MKKRKKSLFLGAVASLMLLGACNDFLTGQDGEPTGPLKVVRLTLIDFGLNTGHLVFTDTSVPSDCTLAQYKDLKQCTSDPFMDTYGVKKSPPNPDSLRRLRVVFNKPPLLDLDAPSRGLNSTELELVPESGVPTDLMLVDQKVIGLSCTNCSTDAGAVGIPLTYNSLQLTGSDLSPDPSQFPYGPGLQMEVLTSCTSAALFRACTSRSPTIVRPVSAKTSCTPASRSLSSDATRAPRWCSPIRRWACGILPSNAGRMAQATQSSISGPAAAPRSRGCALRARCRCAKAASLDSVRSRWPFRPAGAACASRSRAAKIRDSKSLPSRGLLRSSIAAFRCTSTAKGTRPGRC